MEPLILLLTQVLWMFVLWLAIRLNDRITVPYSLDPNRSNPNLNPKEKIS